MRLSVKSALRAVGIRRSGASRAVVTAHRLAEFDRILGAAGLERVSGCTFGFGPFTLFGAPVLPQRLGVQLNNGIQRLADRGAPALRQAGNQYLVLARRAALEHCGPRPAGESHSAGKQDSRSKA